MELRELLLNHDRDFIHTEEAARYFSVPDIHKSIGLRSWLAPQNMNAAHFHLALNHLPVVGLLFALGVLGIGRFLRSDVTMRVGLWLFVASSLFAIPAYLTGEPAEDIVEKLPGIAKSLIERHEEAASVSLAATLVVGLLASVALFMSRGAKAVSWLGFFIVAAPAMFAAGSMAWTAKLGGEIHHTEIRAPRSK